MKSRVFVLGSGFSKEVAGLPMLSELSGLVLGAIRANSTIDVLAENCLRTVTKLVPKQTAENIEHLLSFLWETQPWHEDIESQNARASYSYVTSVIHGILMRGTRGQWSAEAMAVFSGWMESYSTVITFNYDTVVEQLAIAGHKGANLVTRFHGLYQIPVAPLGARSGVGYTWSKPTPGQYFPLLKLHGSVNWLYSGDETFIGQPIYFVEPNMNVKDDLVPLIIPPLLDKTKFYFHAGLKLQWRLAKEAIRKVDEVVFIGYSLPETDLSVRFFFGDALLGGSAKLRVVVSESDQARAQSIRERYLALVDGNAERLDFRNPQKNTLSEVLEIVKSE